jgi:hypothetical protein
MASKPFPMDYQDTEIEVKDKCDAFGQQNATIGATTPEIKAQR